MTQVWGQRKFVTDKPLAKGKGFISGKLLMTKDKNYIFVEYTVVAVFHMIYNMDMSYKYAVDSIYNK